MTKRRILVSVLIGLSAAAALLFLLLGSRKTRLDGQGLRFLLGRYGHVRC